MKKIIVLLMLMLTTAALVPVQAQRVNVNININLDRQPAWGPIGYDYVDFYYFPDLNIYYDVNYGMFYYLSRNRWIATRYLPPKYERYDLYYMYKVVINDPQPWVRNKVHKKQFAHYRGNRTQIVIRNSTDKRYHNSRNNSVRWVEEKKPSTSRTTSSSRQTTTGRTTSKNSSATTSTKSSSTSSRTNRNSSSSNNNKSTGNSSSGRTSTSRTR